MKNLLPILFLFAATASSCQKNVLDSSDSFTNMGPDGVTNFTDLSTSKIPKSQHPFFEGLEQHKYYFGIEAASPCCGQSYSAGAVILPNFTNVPSGNGGNLTVGSYTFVPGADNRYGWFGGQSDPETDPALMDNFGKKTSFSFKGVAGEISPFNGTVHFPKLMNLTNISVAYTPQLISRNQNFSVQYEKDPNNSLPLLLKVYWTNGGDLDNFNISTS